jgi:hypothetical protein
MSPPELEQSEVGSDLEAPAAVGGRRRKLEAAGGR